VKTLNKNKIKKLFGTNDLANTYTILQDNNTFFVASQDIKTTNLEHLNIKRIGLHMASLRNGKLTWTPEASKLFLPSAKKKN